MKRFKNILVVYNGEIGADDALTQAAALARANLCPFRLIRPPVPTTSAHSNRAIRPPVVRRVEA